jgi:hypothetical protein
MLAYQNCSVISEGCWSTGNILLYVDGIFGSYAEGLQSLNCFSLGNIGTGCSDIYGRNAGDNS